MDALNHVWWTSMHGCTCSALNSRWSHAFSCSILCSTAACKCHAMVTYITTLCLYTCQQLWKQSFKQVASAKHLHTEQAIMCSSKRILQDILLHALELAMQLLRNCKIGRYNCRVPVFKYLPRQGHSGLRSIKLLLCVCYFLKQGIPCL